MTDQTTPANANGVGLRTSEAPFAAADGYALTREQREILHHTRHRAAGGHYCGGGKEMDALVAMGLMESHGSFLGNPYFGITAEGVKALRAHTAKNQTPPPMA